MKNDFVLLFQESIRKYWVTKITIYLFIYFYSICFGKSTQFIHILVDLKYTFSCRCWNIYSRKPFRNQSERMRENARITKHIGNQLRTSISSLTASTHHKWCDELYARLKLYIQINTQKEVRKTFINHCSVGFKTQA